MPPFDHSSAPSAATLGSSQPHDSALGHVTGTAHYVDDMPLPAGALHAYPVMASIAYGSLQALDCDPALAIAGVVRVLTAADIPACRDIGPVFPGDVLLAEDHISYFGQPIGLVIATAYEVARKAARAVVARYQEDKAQLDVNQAIANQQWVRPPFTLVRGEVEQALAAAPRQLAGELYSGGQEHFYLEGQVALSQPTDDGGLLITTSTQHPTEIQHLTAAVLGLPYERVTVTTRRMGGAFGGKETQAAQWAIMAALASFHTGQTVKLRLARADDFQLTGKRHPFYSRYQVGFDESGQLLAVAAELTGNCGYSPDLSDAIVDRAMFHADNAYYYPAVRLTGQRARTDTVSHTAFRGFGGPQGMLVAEAILDEVASAVGKDPLAVRLQNLYAPGRDLTPYHQPVEQFMLAKMMTELADKAGYQQRRQAIREFNAASTVIKKGLALTPVKFGISFTVQHLNQAGALLHVYTDGSIHLNHGGTEMGQGLNVKVQQLVAHAFGVPLERVGISATRTDKVPNTSPTAASSGTDLNGMAALNAANAIKQRLVEFMVETFGCTAATVRFENSEVRHDQGRLSFTELVQQAYQGRVSLSATGYYATPKIHFDRAQGKGRPFFYFAHGAALAEVEIDTLTGESAITAVDILHDVGNSINPAIDIGQIEGGFIQGMGWLTTEDLRWAPNGELASKGPATYKIPTLGDMPKHFQVQLYDRQNSEATVFRSKAVGEPPLMLAISVWSALRSAVASLTNYRYLPALHPPATAEAILGAVEQAQAWCAQQQEVSDE